MTISDTTSSGKPTVSEGPRPGPTPVQCAVLEEIAKVLTGRFNSWMHSSKEPVVIHVDGDGRTTLFDKIATELQKRDLETHPDKRDLETERRSPIRRGQ